MEAEKQEIIEMFGVHFEQLYNIPPLAARILGTLIIDGCKSGLTFEELVEKMQASKSSISTNLNLLQKMDKINIRFKDGCKKGTIYIAYKHKIEILGSINSLIVDDITYFE